MNALAIIPARAGSKGIPNKNFRDLCGLSLVERAARAAKAVTGDVVVSSDSRYALANWDGLVTTERLLLRPPALAQDDTPMIDVVRHVLEEIPGPPDQPIVLLQPTQPLRRPEHLTQALGLLTPDVDSVVSVVELPPTLCPWVQCEVDEDAADGPWLEPWNYQVARSLTWHEVPTCRQDCAPSYIRDGTVYAFWRRTVKTHGDLYGIYVRPLVIQANDTCALDTEADWAEAERRLRDRRA